MRNFKIALITIGVIGTISVQAQKKVTYGKSTFTVYQPLPDLAPTPVCGFAPDVPGYTLKSKNYGPGTYYCYAPGNVPKSITGAYLPRFVTGCFTDRMRLRNMLPKGG